MNTLAHKARYIQQRINELHFCDKKVDEVTLKTAQLCCTLLQFPCSYR